MNTILSKSSIIKKTIGVGSSTLMSRCLGILREGLQVMYLGVGMASDAFFTAFKIPNSLRKIFAEGAMSAAFVPTIVQVVRQQGKEQANSLMSLAFLVFEGLVLILCALVMWKAQATIALIAPGFSPETAAFAVPLLRILMPFIFFISSSALLAGTLQAVGHFFVPAFSPVLLNVFFITGLISCWHYTWDVTYLCFFILSGGFVQLIGHAIAYVNLGFGLGVITKSTLYEFGKVVVKFLLVAMSMSILEINLFVDTSFASYLPQGSISLLYYANRFMGIPLGVFATAFSTILLPHFARISAYAPRRLSFYLLEATKLVVWVTIPVTIMMSLLSEKIFSTLFLSEKFKLDQVVQAGHILVVFLCGLLFFSLNKILLNMYYALHVAWIPAVISTLATGVNLGLNYMLIDYLQAPGLALATTIAGIIQTVLFLYFLRWRFNFVFYTDNFLTFVWRYGIQLMIVGVLGFALYSALGWTITAAMPAYMQRFLLMKIGFWLWVGPLCAAIFVALFYTRKWFNVRLYFLD